MESKKKMAVVEQSGPWQAWVWAWTARLDRDSQFW